MAGTKRDTLFGEATGKTVESIKYEENADDATVTIVKEMLAVSLKDHFVKGLILTPVFSKS
jgi:hypothetical protein